MSDALFGTAPAAPVGADGGEGGRRITLNSENAALCAYARESMACCAAGHPSTAIARTSIMARPERPAMRSSKQNLLREELGALKMSALRKRAREAGLGDDAFDEIDDADDPRASL
eukprot:SAG31_NODE_8925_length_1362_cov_5.321457_1_plen_115_part_10